MTASQLSFTIRPSNVLTGVSTCSIPEDAACDVRVVEDDGMRDERLVLTGVSTVYGRIANETSRFA